MLLVKFFNAIVNLFETNCVGVPHWSAAMRREAVPVEIDNVNVDGAQGITFLEDAGAFIDQRVDTTIDNFLPGNFSLGNPRFARPFSYQPGDFRISNGAAVFVILVPASTGFLAVTAHLAETVSGKSLAYSGLLQVAIFFADSPADIETREIADSERAHGHAEIVERGIDSLDAGALFQKKNGLADVRMEHAVADKSAAVPYQDADLADFFRELHARGDDFLAARFAADDFEQTHYVGGAEEVRADHSFGTCGRGSNLVDTQRRGVARQDGAGLRDAVQL